MSSKCCYGFWPSSLACLLGSLYSTGGSLVSHVWPDVECRVMQKGSHKGFCYCTVKGSTLVTKAKHKPTYSFLQRNPFVSSRLAFPFHDTTHCTHMLLCLPHSSPFTLLPPLSAQHSSLLPPPTPPFSPAHSL